MSGLQSTLSPRILQVMSVATLLGALTGCSLVGHKQGCASGQCTQNGGCQSCEPCQECGPTGCDSWMCAHGWCCHGRHPAYHRLPDNVVTRSHARLRAQSDLRDLDNDQCLSCDYRMGYEQAYVDVALGSCGAVPALPPANYWKSCARTPEGHQKAQQWFSGYAAGATRATSVYEPFNKVAFSQFDGWDGCPNSCPTPYGP